MCSCGFLSADAACCLSACNYYSAVLLHFNAMREGEIELGSCSLALAESELYKKRRERGAALETLALEIYKNKTRRGVIT